jgi:hypothetical protein
MPCDIFSHEKKIIIFSKKSVKMLSQKKKALKMTGIRVKKDKNHVKIIKGSLNKVTNSQKRPGFGSVL